MSKEKRMLGNYEITQSIYIGDREVVFGVDTKDPHPFMVCYCDYNNPLSAAWPTEGVASDDYLEAMQIFVDRVQSQIDRTKEELFKFPFDKTVLTEEHCIPDDGMADIKFRDTAHRDFFLENMMKCRVNDCYHRAFFYVMGIASETRANINQMFNFKEDCIEPEGMHGGWQTSGTVKVCHLAFNLWNGYAEEGRERYFTPEELFCCEFAPYFMEGIKVRYPEYCRELPAPRKQTEISR